MHGIGVPENSATALIAGAFTAHVTQIWRGPRVGEYLTANDTRRHVWHAWFSSERVGFKDQNAASAELAYKHLTFSRSKDLIAEGFGETPNGVVRALGQLGAKARSPQIYRALIRIMSQGGVGAKYFRHASELPDELIKGVDTLPPGVEAKSSVALFKEGRVPGQLLGYFTWTLGRLKPFYNAEAADRIISAAKPLEALRSAILALPFPEPPSPGSSLLQPVRSYEELHRVASTFRNCLANPTRAERAVVRVLNGYGYFYHWVGDEPALLCFQQLGRLGWYLREVRGPRNSPVSDRVRDEIVRHLTELPPLCPVWAPEWAMLPDLELFHENEYEEELLNG